jgi:hypothetical protein
MAVTAVLVLMPGGILFLIAWAFGRAYAARLREAQASSAGPMRSAGRALVAVRPHDVWRETRAVTGLVPSPMPSAR